MAKKSNRQVDSSLSAGKQLLAKPLAIFVACVCIILLAIAGITNLVFLNSASQIQLKLTANQQAEDYSRAISSYLEGHQKDLERLITQPRIVNIFLNKDPAEIAAVEDEFKNAFADAIALKLIPLTALGTADPHFSKLLLATIEVDMIQRAIAGQKVLAEGYKQEGNRVGLLAVHKTETGEVNGVLLISLKLKGLYRLLISIAENQRQLKLAQAHSQNNKLSLAEIGSSATNAPVITKSIALAHNWQLEFRPSEALTKTASIDGGITWTIFGVSAVLIIVFGWITYRLTTARLDADINTIGTTLVRWSKGKQGKSPELKISDLNEILFLAKTLVIARKKAASLPAETTLDSEPQKAAPLPQPPAEPEELVGLPDELKMDLFGYQDTTSEAVKPEIFRAYDVRGLANIELSKSAAYQIGMALGSEAKETENSDIIVGRDGRNSSPDLSDNFIRGIIDSGCNVINLGAVPTPLVYFATHKLHANNGAIITGSHLDSEYNGIKMVLNNVALADDAIQNLATRITNQNFSYGLGDHTDLDIIQHYIDDVVSDISLSKSLKVVVDCANAIPAIVAPELLATLNCEVIPLFCELDGNFPNHSPNPNKKIHLKSLVDNVKLHKADLGLAFDGDGDRVVAVTGSGRIVSSDNLATLFVRNILNESKNANIVADVKCGRNLERAIIQNGGNFIMSASGHSRIKRAMAENQAIFGAEYTGHLFFADRWLGFDDGLYSAARLIELIVDSGKSLDELTATLPISHSPEEILVPVADGDQFAIVNSIKDNASWQDASVNTIDGLRVDYENGWGLIRGSNTASNLSLRFEATDAKALSEIQSKFRQAIKVARPNLKLRF
ncbi:MAG: phosphomannomutase/phosphoglucomutase [Pseudomonadales bacterium]